MNPSTPATGCRQDAPHDAYSAVAVDAAVTDRCARIFRAMGEPARLRLLTALAQGPACVGDLAQLDGEPMPAVSQRLRVLRAEDIIRRRRDGKHVVYELADAHTLHLVLNGLAHAAEHQHKALPPSLASRQEHTS